MREDSVTSPPKTGREKRATSQVC